MVEGIYAIDRLLGFIQVSCFLQHPFLRSRNAFHEGNDLVVGQVCIHEGEEGISFLEITGTEAQHHLMAEFRIQFRVTIDLVRLILADYIRQDLIHTRFIRSSRIIDADILLAREFVFKTRNRNDIEVVAIDNGRFIGTRSDTLQ